MSRLKALIFACRSLRCVVLLGLLVSGGVAWAQDIGDVDKGLAYAQRECSSCHMVDRSIPPAAQKIVGPSFADIANTPGMTGRALTVWFSTPHPNMPNLIIPPGDRDDVTAYILSLRLKR